MSDGVAARLPGGQTSNFHREVNGDMLSRNKKYLDIEDPFNKGYLGDWKTSGKLHDLASSFSYRIYFDPLPWHQFFWRSKNIDKDKKPEEAESFVEANQIRYITEEEREGLLHGVFEGADTGHVLMTTSEHEGIENYLVFRALLFGALLDTGADNSCLFDLDIGQQFVLIL
ncbi:hypothetical protein NA56DRAFT_702770 [Hyaloscypha hepaticicola]|uniref:Peptidase A2 domain-containing protein n=1 Tax=Hyaloscypha hepaticicola TaxID=2082293 RepID=A0A2J6Q830_9HELO|nr:hypothetical protein NA56DRAFT_702770 [Hyaloscypha hepaticicola]